MEFAGNNPAREADELRKKHLQKIAATLVAAHPLYTEIEMDGNRVAIPAELTTR